MQLKAELLVLSDKSKQYVSKKDGSQRVWRTVMVHDPDGRPIEATADKSVPNIPELTKVLATLELSGGFRGVGLKIVSVEPVK